jgi:hypothetical protein
VYNIVRTKTSWWEFLLAEKTFLKSPYAKRYVSKFNYSKETNENN